MTTTALFLVFAGLMSRLLPHPPNLVALGAIALYAGARLPRRWALTVPLVIVAFSDVAIDFQHALSGLVLVCKHGYLFNPLSRLTTYAVFTALALAGGCVPRNAGPLTRAGMSVLGSIAFFLASNLAVWAEGSGYDFPRTFAGL